MPVANIQGMGLPAEGLVRLEYTGDRAGTVTLSGRRSGKQYQVSNHPTRRYFLARAEDVPWLLAYAFVRMAPQGEMTGLPLTPVTNAARRQARKAPPTIGEAIRE